MTNSPTPKSLQDLIHLPEREFIEVYECLHKLIVEELLIDHDHLEGSHLINKCMELLHAESDEKKKYDFTKGFLPLYYRMYQSLKQEPGKNRVYSVAFL